MSTDIAATTAVAGIAVYARVASQHRRPTVPRLRHHVQRGHNPCAMELRHLRYFLVVAEEENLQRAAQRLSVDHSALSRRIRDLEIDLGVQLFIRSQQRLHLSPAGRSYFEDISHLLDHLERARQRSRSIASGETGALSLGFHETAVRHRIIARAFHEFRSKYRSVDLTLSPLVPSVLVKAVRERELDAAFVYHCPKNDTDFAHIEVAKDDFLLAAPKTHRLARKRQIQLGDLNGEPFVLFQRDLAPLLYDDLVSACRAGGLRLDIVQHTQNESTRLHLVSAGMGLSFVLASSGRHWDKPVMIRKISRFTVPLQLDLIWRRDNTSQILERFVRIVRRLNANGAAGDPARRRGRD